MPTVSRRWRTTTRRPASDGDCAAGREGSADHALLLTAAHLARYGHDYPQVVRLARAALAEERGPAAVLLLSEALHELGAYQEAEELLASVERDFTSLDDPLRVPLVAMRVRNLIWGLQRPDEALRVNRAARDRIEDPAAREELTADEAMVLTFSGRPVEALAVTEGISGTTGRTVVLRTIAEAPALILTGRCETALQASRRGIASMKHSGTNWRSRIRASISSTRPTR